jgi:hypothetical protein
MEFFEPPPKQPDRPEPKRYRKPEWRGPSENFSPGVAALELVLVNTGEVAVFVSEALVYPNGFEMTLTILAREDSDLEDPVGPIGMRARRFGRGAADGEIPADMLRFGIQFADGRKATNVGESFPWNPEHLPEGPTLTQQGGGGGGHEWHQDFWTWPLPPPGDLLFVCEWPDKQIELTTTSIDAGVILSAATRAQELWPVADLPERPPPSSSSGQADLYLET